MKIHICSLRAFYHLIQQPDFDRAGAAAIISTSGAVRVPLLRGIRYTGAIYDDLDGSADSFGRLFTMEMANKFARFIRSLDDSVCDLWCVCDGGVRRSAAVACGAAVYFGQDDMPIWRDGKRYEPNPWVARLLFHALEIPMSDLDFDVRIEENRQALRKAFRSARQHGKQDE